MLTNPRLFSALLLVACAKPPPPVAGFTPYSEGYGAASSAASALAPAAVVAGPSPSSGAEETPAAIPSACREPITSGNCADHLIRWIFDAEKGVCRRFNYTGCGGSANNFRSLPECEDTCQATVRICELPADPGSCDNRQVRWTFDPRKRKCVEFDYGGCEGNQNNFLTHDECAASCGNRSHTKP